MCYLDCPGVFCDVLFCCVSVPCVVLSWFGCWFVSVGEREIESLCALCCDGLCGCDVCWYWFCFRFVSPVAILRVPLCVCGCVCGCPHLCVFVGVTDCVGCVYGCVYCCVLVCVSVGWLCGMLVVCLCE